jgi:phosphopantothenate synthetase
MMLPKTSNTGRGDCEGRMSEVVKRMARAILKEAGLMNLPEIQDDVTKRLATSMVYAERYAAAALKAIREPTLAMWNAGNAALVVDRKTVDLTAAWRAMIDEALRDEAAPSASPDPHPIPAAPVTREDMA